MTPSWKLHFLISGVTRLYFAQDLHCWCFGYVAVTILNRKKKKQQAFYLISGGVLVTKRWRFGVWESFVMLLGAFFFVLKKMIIVTLFFFFLLLILTSLFHEMYILLICIFYINFKRSFELKNKKKIYISNANSKINEISFIKLFCSYVRNCVIVLIILQKNSKKNNNRNIRVTQNKRYWPQY